MKILITGGTGFIGRELTRRLLREGYEIYVLSRKDKFTESYPYKNEVNMVVCDIMEKIDLGKIKPDVIIHMASLTPVRHSFRSPIEYMSVNYFGTVNIVQSAYEAGVRCFVHYSTIESYFSGRNTTSAPIGGETPYGISKSAADLYVQYAFKAGLIDKVLIVRPCNTYDRSCMGSDKDSREYFVEKTVISMIKDEREIRYDGSPHVVRSWIHVSDHVDTLCDYLEKYVLGSDDRSMNVKNIVGVEASCLEVFETSRKLLGWSGEVYWNCKPRPFDPPILTAACSDEDELEHARRVKPIDKGLELTIKNWRDTLSSLGEI